MAYDIGPRIGIEGEKQFRDAIKDINTHLKTLGTEMMAVTSKFNKNDNSVEALTAKNKVLNKQIEAQRQKLSELQKGLDAATQKYGENSRITQGWQQAVNRATAELNNMERELDDNRKAMNELGNEMEDTSTTVDGAGGRFEKLGSILKRTAVAAGAFAVAVGAAAVKLGKDAVSAFADYEQLVGGVETLFKTSSQKLQAYANDAYKTAGLSANAYMETVTSFSASLIQSLGGDTKKAVEYANKAVVDMSDNANKMGTDMTLIQNAYQGFAKQNYTMLDNLKLGYGGTKEEMERLLADAQKISGIKYDISSYADIVDAIHVIQTQIGITGTTAREAEATISGSINAMKSAWENWVTGLGNSKADMKKLTQNLVDGFQTVASNITPIIENITAALPTALVAIIPTVGTILTSLLSTTDELFSKVLEATLSMLPSLVSAGKQALTSLIQGLTQTMPELIPIAISIVTKIADTITNNIGKVVDIGIDLLLSLVKGIIDSLPILIKEAPRIINEFSDTLYAQLPKILKAGVKIVEMIIKGIISSVPTLIANLPQIILAIVNVITLYNWANLGKTLTSKIGEGIKSMRGNITNVAKSTADGVKNGINNVFKSGFNWGKNLISSICNGFSSMKNFIINSASSIGSSAINAIKSVFSGAINIGKNLVRGIWDGIKAAKDWILDNIGGFAGSILSGFRAAFGIHSPSKVMKDEVGVYISEGIAEGIISGIPEINSAIDTVSSVILNGFKSSLNSSKDINSYLPEFLVNAYNSKDIGKKIYDEAKKNKTTTDTREQIDLLFEKSLNSLDSEIDKLSIDTGDLNKNLENQNRIIEIQQAKVKLLEAQWKTLGYAFGYSSKETISAKKTLDDATTSLVKLGQEAINQSEKIKSTVIDDVNNLAGKIKNSLKSYYEDMKKEAEKSIDAQIKANNKWKDNALDNLEKVYNAKKKAIDDEISELDKRYQDEDDAEREAEIKRKLSMHIGAQERAELQKELNELVKQRNRRHEKEELEAQKKAIENQYNIDKENIERIAKSNEENYNAQLDEIKSFYEKKQTEANLDAEVQKMIIENNQKDIISLLRSYGDSYEIAGASLGDRLVTGLKNALSVIPDMIDSITSQLNTLTDNYNIGSLSLPNINKISNPQNNPNITVQNHLYLDGKEVAAVTTPYTNSIQGTSLALARRGLR